MPATILLVEDEQASATLIREALASTDYVLTHALNCKEASRYAETLRPDLIILDINLPDGSGIDLCREFRKNPLLTATPIIILTGKSELEDKTVGFEAGADHYLIKPFQIQELRLWTNALLRRIQYSDKEGGLIRAPDFIIDPQTHRVDTLGQTINNLTKKEFDLLYELVRHTPKILSKETLLSHVWGTILRDNTVEAHIKNLRLKLGAAANRIETVPGVGYRFQIQPHSES